MQRRSGLLVAFALALAAACVKRDGPPPTPASRAAHKAAIAAAANDRLVLQYLVKDAEAVNARIGTMRRSTAGFVTGDTNVIWFGFFAGDTLLVLDETRRGPPGVEENARYLFRDTLLHYVALDRSEATPSGVPRRMRLAFGYDSAGVLSATSKNVNDAAQPLDSADDVSRIAARARALRVRVIASGEASRAAPTR
ncbi:MAG: hypothetical protein H7099_15040 [Gemmatimonadaceae bacterium]|nr:hypothetical protein [Gemmatimonadaceae bacterium]